MSINIRIILLFIIGLAFALRVTRVWENPPALSWDEVSIGYNAYSILKTGHDEHGRFLPLDTFVAYGDYKPPLPIYITAPFVAIFGLNELSVRLPSALFGTLTVLTTYFLVIELFSKEVQSSKSKFQIKSKAQIFQIKNMNSDIHWSFGIGHLALREVLALLSSLLLALSPWHINLSRAGFEANIALFFIVFGVWLTLSSRSHPKRWTLAWLPFAASMYTFNSARYFVPFMGIGLICYLWKYISLQKKNFAMGILFAFLLLLPLLPHLISKEARLRYTEVNIFTDLSIVERANTRMALDKNSFISKIFDNRRIGYFRSFLSHYFDHFTADFLFIKGDGNPKFSTQDVGQLYIVDLPFLLLGVYFMFVYFRPEAWLLSYWLLTAIIPAATARETPHALRILNTLPTWQIFIAFGIIMIVSSVMRHVSRIKIKGLRSISLYIFYSLLIILYFFNISYYLHNYYVHYPRLYSGEWQYGYEQALAYANANGSTYEKIYVSEAIGRAYMYTLFYTIYDPLKFQKNNSSYFDAAGFYHVDGFDKYIFSNTLPADLTVSSLYIFPPNQVPIDAKILQTVSLLNGDPVLTIFEK